MKSFTELLLEELSNDEINQHMKLNTAIQFKNKKFKLRDRTKFQGIPISIENKKGDIRAGIDPDGNKWNQTMTLDYGFIPNKISADDGEGLDVYIGDDRKSPFVYSVKQHKIELVKKWPTNYCPKCSEFYPDCQCPEFYDEDKIFLGFRSKESVRHAYLKQYDNPRFLGPISELSMEEFKKLLSNKTKNDKISLPLQYKS